MLVCYRSFKGISSVFSPHNIVKGTISNGRFRLSSFRSSEAFRLTGSKLVVRLYSTIRTQDKVNNLSRAFKSRIAVNVWRMLLKRKVYGGYPLTFNLSVESDADDVLCAVSKLQNFIPLLSSSFG
jgi:hypothetical protein